jgi:hypothetical protein
MRLMGTERDPAWELGEELLDAPGRSEDDRAGEPEDADRECWSERVEHDR